MLIDLIGEHVCESVGAVAVRDPGRIINNPLEVEMFGGRELTVTGISAGKDWLSGAVSAERALGGSFSARKSLFQALQ